MPAYFICSLCRRISVMHQLRSRCPECGSRSGQYSGEPPRAAAQPRAVDEIEGIVPTRLRNRRGRRSKVRDRRGKGDRRTAGIA